MARCGCAGTCGCVLQAGTGTTVTGTGTAANPWQVDAGCACAVQAGAGVTITGAGTPASPWVVAAAAPSCESIMDCVGSKLGAALSYNATTHVFGVKFSTDANNIVSTGSDGGLFVPVPGTPGSASIAVVDSQELDFAGDGTAGSPVGATLTGLRAGGDWAIPDGDLQVGKATAAGRAVAVTNLNTGKVLTTGLFNSRCWNAATGDTSGFGTVLSLVRDGVEVNRAVVGDDGALYLRSPAGTYRPVPYATAAGQTLNIGPAGGGVTLNRAVTFPSGRFSAVPVVQATGVSASTSTFACVTSATQTGAQIKLYNPTALTAPTCALAWSAVQMTPVAGAGLAVPQEAGAVTVTATCHTPGCVNEDVPIVLGLDDAAVPVVCGPCGLPINDVREG